ncbi:MAG: hypothetical protein ACK4SZ_01050 [Allosphingosinicella sp.]|uniref:hypothetical protein n=1 Tax=Allosphingosinicella sp. TaxID=2823234 RepID=UPI003931C46F
MSLLLTSLAALLSVAQADAPPPPELVERFIAALPQPQRRLDEVDSATLDRLKALNPGRENDLRPILQAHAFCTAPLMRGSTDRMLHQVAARLGAANLEALIRFYEGSDLARFGTLAEKTDRTAEESAEFERLMSAYPVEAFMEAMQASAASALFDDESFFVAMNACDRQQSEALARANLRSQD